MQNIVKTVLNLNLNLHLSRYRLHILCLRTMYNTQNIIMLSNEMYDINQYLQGQRAVKCEPEFTPLPLLRPSVCIV
jgi:hypothetical protein